MRSLIIAGLAVFAMAFAMPASAATCSASILSTSGHPDIVLRIKKDGREMLFSRVAAAELDGAGTYLKVWNEGGVQHDFGGCDGLTGVMDRIEEFMGRYNESLFP